MKFKLLPPAPDEFASVAEAHRAVPLVPGSETDCCARLMRRLDLPSRDVARTWLTFLRALELAEETDSGFVRVRRDVERAAVADAFRRRVFGASEVLTTLAAEGPLSADEVFERVADEVPTWEHHKNPGTWREVWRDRVGTVLEWAVLLDLAERTDAGYRVVEA